MHLLQRAYRNPSALDPVSEVELRLISHFPSIYGASIRHPVLRQAVVLFCMPFWPDMFDQSGIKEQQRRILYALSVRITDPNEVDEADLLAILLVAQHYALLARTHGDFTEASRHAKNFYSLLTHVFRRFRISGQRLVFEHLWPLLVSHLLGVRCSRGGGFVFLDKSQSQISACIQACEWLPSPPRIKLSPLDPVDTDVHWMGKCFVTLRSLYLWKQSHLGVGRTKSYGKSFRAKINRTLERFDQERAFASIDASLSQSLNPDIFRSETIALTCASLFQYYLSQIFDLALHPPSESLLEITLLSSATVGTRFVDCLVCVERIFNQHIVRLAPTNALLEQAEIPGTGGGTNSFRAV